MDVDLGLATRRNAVKQHHGMLHPLHAYLVVSVALGGTELGGTLKMGLKGMVESPHLVLKRGEDATLDEIGKDSRGGVGDIQQSLASEQGRWIGGRQLEVGLVNLKLLGGAAQHLKRHLLAFRRGKLLGQGHAGLHLRAILRVGLQSCGKGRAIHIAKRAHIIISYPAP